MTESPTVHWYGLQTMLEQCESDVLILLDCCAAASSAAASGNGVTELIAACGFETWALGVGEHSFSRSLIEELNSLASQVLEAKIYFAICIRETNPIYVQLANELRCRSIELSILPFNRASPDMEFALHSMIQFLDQSSDSGDVCMLDSEPSQSSLAEVWPDPNFKPPKVPISVALEDDQRLQPEA
ncbi:MAG: hypothetical protein Q9170_002246 [Blastenia crenularia]